MTENSTVATANGSTHSTVSTANVRTTTLAATEVMTTDVMESHIDWIEIGLATSTGVFFTTTILLCIILIVVKCRQKRREREQEEKAKDVIFDGKLHALFLYKELSTVVE